MDNSGYKKIEKKKVPNWKVKVHEIIFEADTKWGKFFDVVLLWAILLSVLAVILETVEAIHINYGEALFFIEWFFTILFTIEYVLRVSSVGKPFKYIFSFMGMVDLLSLIPTYLSLVVVGSHYLLVIRTIRLMRIFRILKLTRYVREANVLRDALRASAVKITVFIGGVIVLVLIMGSIMYIVEGPENGFTSIPTSMYWTIVTITTVGYGDIAPLTTIGQTIASMIMLLGYGIIAVPTGIVTAQIAINKNNQKISTQCCPECSEEGHDPNAAHCKFCGAKLNG
jgi:voltage-gated potassium channel